MKDIISYSNPKSEIGKRYIDLKDSIVNLSDENMKVIMITSPKEEVRHANLAANLAVVMGTSGFNTLIIDCNIENSTLHEVFGVNIEMGVTDYVLEKRKLIDVIKNTQLNTLKLVTIGKKDINVLGNKRLVGLIDEGKDQFDYIIINSPSALIGNGSQILARYCDGTVIVVDQEKTEMQDVKRTQCKLGKFKDKIIGCVLNNYKEY